MILFYCEHCAHKISVRDNYVGKQGKCSKCGSVFVVPAESTIVEFRCERCERMISAPKSHAGKKAVCPKCKSTFIIPTDKFTGSAATRNDSGDLIARTIDSPHDLTLIDVPEEYKQKDQPGGQYSISTEAIISRQESDEDSKAEQAESADRRKLPWILDMFLYPFNMPGLKHIAIFTGVPLLIAIVMRVIPGFFYMLFFYISLVVYSVLIVYMFWYISVCIRDSADGWVRAPEGLGSIPDLSDMFEQVVNIIGCLGVCFGPAVIYALFADVLDVIFWLLLSLAFFLYPMGLLAVAIYDSPVGFNPRVLFRSISSTFFPYCCLILLIFAIGGLIAVMLVILPRSQLRPYILIAVCTYMTMVTAHILGCFYFKHREKLKWKV
jgi:hypothetical protein